MKTVGLLEVASLLSSYDSGTVPKKNLEGMKEAIAMVKAAQPEVV